MTTRGLPFPRNLTPGQVRCIVAVREHGNQAQAAAAIGISHHTLDHALGKARLRAGAKTTAALVDRYTAATGQTDGAPARAATQGESA
jgi:hypothetical protein